jgi:uracil-DNA glycosylase family 4
MKISNITDLRTEFTRRALQAGLSIDCPMDGTFNAQIAVIAEAPGESEVHKKLPLIGASGSKLWQSLRPYNISRMDCYITNVSKRQVAFSDKGRDSINKGELGLWNELLLWELSQLPNLKYVVALGNFALSALLGHQGITQWRGSVIDAVLPNGRVVKVLCTYNPAMILREPKTEITFRFDLKKLQRVIDGKFKVPQITTHINPSYDDAIGWINQMRQGSSPVAFDIETMAQETACVGLANSGSEAMCINWRTNEANRYTLDEERNIRLSLSGLFQDPKVRLVAQNGMFDITWLWFKDRIRVPRVWFDTMLAHHTLYPTLPHNLGFLTTQYTDHPYYKDEKDDWRDVGDIDAYWQYNGKDCCLTWLVHEREHRELEASQLSKFFFDHVMQAQPILARMTVGGVKIDTELKDEIRSDLLEQVAVQLQEFHNSVRDATGIDGYNPNPKSPVQLSELFFRHLKLVGRGTSTNAENRERMRKHPRTGEAAKRVLTALDAYAKDHKFLTTYAEMEIDPDGRARCEYKQTGVQQAPGRLSSSKVMWGSGMNLQNQPSRAYPMFVADEGMGSLTSTWLRPRLGLSVGSRISPGGRSSLSVLALTAPMTRIGPWRAKCSVSRTTRFPPTIVMNMVILPSDLSLSGVGTD